MIMDLRLTNLAGDVVMGVGAGTAFTGNGGFTTAQGLFWLQSDSGNFERRLGTSWIDVGGGTSLSVSTNYSIRVLANGSASPISYSGGSLAANTMDIYLDGTLIDDDAPVTTAGLSANGFRVYQINQGDFEIDNIQLFDAIAVPEPTSLALGGVGLVALAGVVRARRKVAAAK